jgi:L-ribulokinase
MAIVAGVEFGTLSVRVTLLDSDRGRLGTASSEYPLERRREDPNFRNTVAYRTDARVGAGNSVENHLLQG